MFDGAVSLTLDRWAVTESQFMSCSLIIFIFGLYTLPPFPSHNNCMKGKYLCKGSSYVKKNLTSCVRPRVTWCHIVHSTASCFGPVKMNAKMTCTVWVHAEVTIWNASTPLDRERFYFTNDSLSLTPGVFFNYRRVVCSGWHFLWQISWFLSNFGQT